MKRDGETGSAGKVFKPGPMYSLQSSKHLQSAPNGMLHKSRFLQIRCKGPSLFLKEQTWYKSRDLKTDEEKELPQLGRHAERSDGWRKGGGRARLANRNSIQIAAAKGYELLADSSARVLVLRGRWLDSLTWSQTASDKRV